MSSSTFTEEEIEKIQQLRSSCSAVLNGDQNDDYYLIRWLRARNLDLGKAEEMLRKALKWRTDNEVDGILEREEIPLKYKKIYPTALLGRDRDECVVILFPFGRFNHRILLGEVGMETALRYNAIWMETMMRYVKQAEVETGKKGLRLVEVVDLEGYSYKELTYGLGRDFILFSNQCFDANYPEVIKSILVINAPKIFTVLFNFIKPFLSKEILSKVSIYGVDEKQWKSVLGEKLNLDHVPTRWGGNKIGEDEFCSQNTEVWIHGPIPLGFFTQDRTPDGLKIEKIHARSKFHLDIPIDTSTYPGLTPELRWKFKVENHDIGFSILYKEDPSNSKNESSSSSPSAAIILPECKLDSKQGIKEGNLKCCKSGVYTLIFDNSYSLTRSKTVFYSVQVGAPCEDE